MASHENVIGQPMLLLAPFTWHWKGGDENEGPNGRRMHAQMGRECRKGKQQGEERKTDSQTRMKWKYPCLTSIKPDEMIGKRSLKDELMALSICVLAL
jgi:hypothetical protein